MAAMAGTPTKLPILTPPARSASVHGMADLPSPADEPAPIGVISGDGEVTDYPPEPAPEPTTVH